MVLPALYEPGKPLKMFLANCGKKPVTIRRGRTFANASPVDALTASATREISPVHSALRVDPPEGGFTEVSPEEVDAFSKEDVPEHLLELFEETVPHLRGREDQALLAKIFRRYAEAFAKSENDLGTIKDAVHKIDTGTAKPIKQGMRRTPQRFAGEEQAELQRLLQSGVIRPSSSEWASPPVLVRKKSGKLRY